MLLFCDSCWLYSLRLYIAGNFPVVKSHWSGKKFIHISQRFYRFEFLLHIFFIFDKCVFTLSVCKAYVILWVTNRFVGSETPKHNAFDQFWKFKFHFEHFPRNSWFLSFGGPSNYLYLFKNHRKTFSWPRKRPPSHLKVIKMWFDQNIKYLLEPFFADFFYREDISCFRFN